MILKFIIVKVLVNNTKNVVNKGIPMNKMSKSVVTLPLMIGEKSGMPKPRIKFVVTPK